MIRLDEITKIYSTENVLNNISMEIKKGERIGLVGSNGAGKSTLFKILTGEVEHTSGFIFKRGNPKIAYLKQEFDLSYKRTVRQELESAFNQIQKVSQDLKNIERQMKLLQINKQKDNLNFLINKYDLYQRKYESLGGYKIKAEIEKLLPKLGFSSLDAEELVEKFSGGWQMKIGLGKIMLQDPDLLLLDEPTNHLDMNTICWLEEYLSSLKISILLISHDRYFLDKVCNKIVFIEQGISSTFNGNYSFSINQKFLNEEIRNKSYLRQKKDIDNQKKYIERFRASATRSSQAKSREKQIQKLQTIDPPKNNSHNSSFFFLDSPRSGKEILHINDLSHSYDEKIVFFEANLKVSAGQKIAFLGPNGSGKSTLFKLIMKKIKPELGQITLGKHNIKVSYYEQNQSEALDPKKLVIDLIFAIAPNWTQQKVRTFLGGFGFSKDAVFKNVYQLSGGEKSRLALALMVMQPSNFMLLDEPTNHLDISSKENLELAIKTYKGTVLLISHDRYFISKVANRIVEISNFNLNAFDGNYQYYMDKRKKDN